MTNPIIDDALRLAEHTVDTFDLGAESSDEVASALALASSLALIDIARSLRTLNATLAGLSQGGIGIYNQNEDFGEIRVHVEK